MDGNNNTCLFELGNTLAKSEIEIIKEIRKLQKQGWGMLEIIVKDGKVTRFRSTNEIKLPDK